MPQSFSSIFVHLVFSTKNRIPFLKDVPLRSEIHAYFGGISKRLDCLPIIVGGTSDHVHILSGLCRTLSASGWVKEMKRVSSIWIEKRESSLKDFSWQAGYGIFSVSKKDLHTVSEYIHNQEEHHKKMSFQEEYREILRQYEIEWDERYVWD